MRCILIAAAFVALAAPTNAEETETRAEDRADVRCLLAMGVMRNNPQFRDASGYGSFYFAGRIQGRSPDLDLAQAMRREAGRMPRSDYPVEGRRCGAELAAVNQQFQRITGNLEPRGVGR